MSPFNSHLTYHMPISIDLTTIWAMKALIQFPGYFGHIF
jgi:hypothetical protein